MSNTTALTLPERAALALDSSKTEGHLRELVKSTSDMLEVLNRAARDQIHSAAMTYRDHRVTIEKTGKASRDDATKFSKAVIAEESRLIEIISPEEKRLLALRDAYDAKIEAEKQSKIAIERARVEAIHAKIDAFGKLVLQAAGKSSQDISILRAQLTRSAPRDPDAEFEEFLERAFSAYDEAGLALEVAYNAAYDAEQAIEAARIKREEEDRQRAADAAKLEEQRAEQERIAAAQAAESKRLADIAAAQAAELARAQKEADDKIKADAARESARLQAEADARAAEHAKAVAELEAQRKAFEAQQEAAARAQAAAAKAIEDAARLESDHTEALAMNAAMIEFPKATDDPEIESLAELVDSGAVADALIADAFDFPEPEPSDEEIVAFYVEAFGGTASAAIERLSRFSGDLLA